MKRITLILATALCFATIAMNAQNFVGDIGGELSVIPGIFTTNGHPYVVLRGESNYSIYQSDFITHVVDINEDGNNWNSYIDFDNMVCSSPSISMVGRSLDFTQNLFNTDDNFEYLHYDDDFSSIQLKSSNGSTLWSFNAEEGNECECCIIKLDNQYYLLVTELRWLGENWETTYHIYFISQGQSITEVKTKLPISVFPSIANRSQQITVELGEGNNATEITVINGLGQVIKRMPVEEGQRQVTIPAQELNCGLNVVNTRTQQGQGSCKIIVR